MFEIQIRMIPVAEGEDTDMLLFRFLTSIGYIKYGDNDFESAKSSVGFRLFKALMEHPEKYWSAEELMAYLKISRPTLYRHLNKLKALDILEEKQDGMEKKYRIRYGNLAKAWNFVEANIHIAMENYRKIVEKITSLMEG